MTDTKLLRTQLTLLRRDYREQFTRLSSDQKFAMLAEIGRIEHELGFDTGLKHTGDRA